MMSTVENPKMTLADLAKIEGDIRLNKADGEVYRRLDNYLRFIGNADDYFLNRLREGGILSYEDFINQRTRPSNYQIPYLVGIAMGVVSTIRKYISGK